MEGRVSGVVWKGKFEGRVEGKGCKGGFEGGRDRNGMGGEGKGGRRVLRRGGCLALRCGERGGGEARKGRD